MRARALFLMLVVLALGPEWLWAREVVSTGPGGRLIEGSFFGLHLRYGTTKTPWPQPQFHSWRVITPQTEWRGLEPQRNRWDFSHLDKAVQLAEKNGVEVLLTLGQTPRWASSRPQEVVPNGPGASAEPRAMSDWENYIRTIARRYKGRIKYYELWNEPRLRELDGYRARPGFTGNVLKLVELGRVAKDVLADEDPAATLISPAFDAGFVGLPRVDLWLDSGGGEIAPILAYHFYLRPPERMAKLYAQLRALAIKHGYPNMPIWNTESGYFVYNPEKPVAPRWPGSDSVFAKVLTPEENAAYMVRAHLISAAAGVERLYWYSWDILDMGLTRGYGQVQTAGSRAYATLLRWLRGAVIKECATDNDDTWVCHLERNGDSAYAVWNVSGDKPFAVPAQMQVNQAEAIDGRRRLVEGGRLQVGIAPVLLIPANSAWTPSGR